MRRPRAIAIVTAIVGLVALGAPAAAAVPSFTPIELPNLPGGTTSEGADVNDAGRIVGWAMAAGGSPHAVAWQDGEITDLGTVGTDTASYATAISGNGLIVGVSGASPLEPSETGHAVLWQDGDIIDLGLLPGGSYSAATDVNDAGQVVGCGQMDERAGLSKVRRGFLWEDGEMTILPPLEPESDLVSTASCAMSINDRGEIVGNSVVHNLQTGEQTVRAVTWQDGVPIDLGTVAGDPHSLAVAISENGRIVGSSGTFFGGPDVRYAAVWTGGRARSLARPGGALFSVATDVSNRSVAVGQYATEDEMYGCRWIGGAVSALLPRPGDESSAALGISSHGLIVGWSQDALYGLHAGHLAVGRPVPRLYPKEHRRSPWEPPRQLEPQGPRPRGSLVARLGR